MTIGTPSSMNNETEENLFQDGYTSEEIQTIFEEEIKKVLFAFEDDMLALETEIKDEERANA